MPDKIILCASDEKKSTKRVTDSDPDTMKVSVCGAAVLSETAIKYRPHLPLPAIPQKTDFDKLFR
jgi:hypothetical protein